MSQNKVCIFVALAVKQRNVITIVQRQAKSTVITLGYYTHQLGFIIPHQWLLDLEPEPKQLEASPPKQRCLQLAGVCKSKSVSYSVISCIRLN